MIKIIMQNESIKRFNLDCKREHAMVGAWKAMRDDEAYKDKAFKIKTKSGSIFNIRLDDIKILEHEPDVEYVDNIKVCTKKR